MLPVFKTKRRSLWEQSFSHSFLRAEGAVPLHPFHFQTASRFQTAKYTTEILMEKVEEPVTV